MNKVVLPGDLSTLPPEILEQLGKCDICGAIATHFSRDILRAFPFDNPFGGKMTSGKVMRRCEEHAEEGRIIDLREGPLMYEARMRAEGKW